MTSPVRLLLIFWRAAKSKLEIRFNGKHLHEVALKVMRNTYWLRRAVLIEE